MDTRPSGQTEVITEPALPENKLGLYRILQPDSLHITNASHHRSFKWGYQLNALEIYQRKTTGTTPCEREGRTQTISQGDGGPSHQEEAPTPLLAHHQPNYQPRGQLAQSPWLSKKEEENSSPVPTTPCSSPWQTEELGIPTSLPALLHGH